MSRMRQKIVQLRARVHPMICLICGGEVLWVGRLSDLKETKCQSCSETNCQEAEVASSEKIKGDAT